MASKPAEVGESYLTSYTTSQNADGCAQLVISTIGCRGLDAEPGQIIDVYETERGVELVPREEGET